MNAAPLDIRQLARPEVRSRAPYTLDRRPVRFRLDQCELPWEWPRRVKQRIGERFVTEAWSRYPEGLPDRLAAALARRTGWVAEGILTGNGSDDLLSNTFCALAGPGQEILTLAPGFRTFELYAARTGATVRWLGPRADLRLPLAELHAELAVNPARWVILTSPNNPTGEVIPPQVVSEFAGAVAGPLVLDNTYGDFSTTDYLPLLAKHRNLLISRTFSKAWALAGLRLGYLLGDPALIAEINKIRLPYSTGVAGAVAALTLLDEESTFRCRLRGLLRLRPRWGQMLAAAGFEVFPSDANFFLVRVPGPAAEATRIYQGLLERGLRVRDLSSGPGLAGCLRISVGSAQALGEVRQGLAELLGGAP